jgi:hypothetical protein
MYSAADSYLFCFAKIFIKNVILKFIIEKRARSNFENQFLGKLIFFFVGYHQILRISVA